VVSFASWPLFSLGKISQYLTFTGPYIVIYFCSKSNQRHQCIKFYFGITVHVSDGLSVYHQEFTTVRTAILLLLTS